MGEKQQRYVEAYSRITSSVRSGHFFEAITIEESIISDRIASFLEATNTLSSEYIHRQSFSALIELWRLAVKNPGSIWEDCEALIQQVDSWRQERNRYVHGLVKFPNQKANVPTTQQFIDGARKAANEGATLARNVSDWRRRQAKVKRRYNAVSARRIHADTDENESVTY